MGRRLTAEPMGSHPKRIDDECRLGDPGEDMQLLTSAIEAIISAHCTVGGGYCGCHQTEIELAELCSYGGS